MTVSARNRHLVFESVAYLLSLHKQQPLCERGTMFDISIEMKSKDSNEKVMKFKLVKANLILNETIITCDVVIPTARLAHLI